MQDKVNHRKSGIKIGLFSIGLDTYWTQFDGLLDNLNGNRAEIRERLAGMDAQVVDAGMVDNPENAGDAAKVKSKHSTPVILPPEGETIQI